MAIEPVIDDDFMFNVGRRNGPLVLSRLGDGKRGSVPGGGGESFDIPGLFAHGVRTGRPNRLELEELGCAPRGRKTGFDIHIVWFPGGEPQDVAHGVGWLKVCVVVVFHHLRLGVIFVSH
jgi:hypothetical protein